MHNYDKQEIYEATYSCIVRNQAFWCTGSWQSNFTDRLAFWHLADQKRGQNSWCPQVGVNCLWEFQAVEQRTPQLWTISHFIGKHTTEQTHLLCQYTPLHKKHEGTKEGGGRVCWFKDNIEPPCQAWCHIRWQISSTLNQAADLHPA